eukprot:637058-Pyramimonas_sp.AAC.1
MLLPTISFSITLSVQNSKFPTMLKARLRRQTLFLTAAASMMSHMARTLAQSAQSVRARMTVVSRQNLEVAQA